MNTVVIPNATPPLGGGDPELIELENHPLNPAIYIEVLEISIETIWYIFKEASLMVPFNSADFAGLSVIIGTIRNCIGIIISGR